MECKTDFMVVKIRFGRGPVVTRRQGKNSSLAMLAASLLTMVSVSCGALGLWRLGSDLGWAGNFVVAHGLLSHWQVWIGVAVAVQYGAWRLTSYAKAARERDAEELADATPAPARVSANV